MKATMRFSAGSAKHNDRTFDLDKAEHIDQNKTDQNQYYIFSKNPEDKKLSFEDYELKYYEKHYSESLTATNEKYIAQHHPERVREMSDWLKTYKPTEAILQLGNKDEHIKDPKQLKTAFKETFEKICKKYPQIKPLDMALHMDEATPHIQFRFVINGHDKSGNLKPLKTQGLKEAGIERPDLSKPESRYNNPLQTFTNEVRELFYTEIEKLGIDLDREVRPENQHVDILQYKQQQEADKLENITSQRAQLEQEYSDKQATLEKEFKAQQATLEKEFATKKQELATKELKLSKKEKALKGRELSLDELKELKNKTFWTTEDKENVIKTAKLSAKNADRAENADLDKNIITKKYNALKKENTSLKAQVPTFEEKLHYDSLENTIEVQNQTIEALKKDISVRDTFIKESGLKEQFKDYCHDIGHKLKVAIEQISHGLHVR